MHIRTTTIRRNGKTYRYAQLVESFRRDDGVPTTRMIAHLGALPEQEIANIKLALQASRSGRSVVLPDSSCAAGPKILANFAYLDVAVALEMWKHWGLDQLLCSVLPQHEQQVKPEQVVAALAVQRCVDPGSKLYAERWFPRSALPELLSVPAAQFNNTRIHRVLEMLDQCSSSLQTQLTRSYQGRDGAFTSLFLDVTDTWFVGRGPELAHRAKTKEGLYERKIGIVLMCNEAGFPVRWEVIAGRQGDGEAMLDLLEATRKVSWLDQAPIVMDRALGRTVYLRALLDSGLRFLTALTKEEFEAYTDRIPHQAVACIHAFDEDAAQQAQAAVINAGMQQLNDRILALDLAVVERRSEQPFLSRKPACADDSLARSLQMATRMSQDLREGKADNCAQLGQTYGLTQRWAAKLMRLLLLAPDLQQIIESGGAPKLPINCALRIAKLTDHQQQREVFDREVRRAAERPLPRRSARSAVHVAAGPSKDIVRLRAVLCFNPEQFVEQRRGADEQLGQVNTFVAELNQALASPHSRRTKETAYAHVHAELRRRNLVDAFDIAVLQERGGLRVSLSLREQAWRQRRRFDGFSVLVAHPDVVASAAELDRLFRAKDAVEKDFHVIKSVVQLRPVRHRTEPKVRAHVTLCMLALLLERTVERKLTAAGLNLSAAMAFELLRTVHLNQLTSNKTPVYTVTSPNTEQEQIVRALGLSHLLEDEQITARITPR
jgi:hypothetical protein